jgi:AcrR family transcriptional regulator
VKNTLFRHFDHKEQIFWAVIRWHLSELKPTRDLLRGIAPGDSPDVVMPQIIEMLEDTANYRSVLLRLIAIAIIELPTKVDDLLMQYISPVFSIIRKYMETNITNGTIRNMESTMLAFVMIMTALTHPMLYNLVDGDKTAYSNRMEAHREHAKFWLDLIVPRTPTAPLHMAQAIGEYSV